MRDKNPILFKQLKGERGVLAVGYLLPLRTNIFTEPISSYRQIGDHYPNLWHMVSWI